MLDSVKKEIENFIMLNMKKHSFEELVGLIYVEYPRYEHVGYALHIYYQEKKGARNES